MDAKWTIAPAKITSAEVVGEYVYNGEDQTAELIVKAGDLVLTADDYTVTGNTGMKEGAYKATVTGTDNFTGTASADWKILPAEITSVEVVGTYTYSGKEQSVELVVKAGEMTVYAGDYKVTGNTATDAGEHTVTVTGTGSYAGVVDAKWTIDPLTIASVETTVAPETVTVYSDADQVAVTVTVKDAEGNVIDDIELVDGTYTITNKAGETIADLATALKTADEYTITPVVQENGNYAVAADAVKAATLTVNKKTITVTVEDIETDTAAPVPTITPVVVDADGKAIGDADLKITITDAEGKEINIVDAVKAKGTYKITVTVGNTNYIVDEVKSDLEAILTVKHYVAAVGQDKYETVQEAVDEAEDGGIVQLLDNAGLALVDKSLTIIRNGHSATVAAMYGYTITEASDVKYVIKPSADIDENLGGKYAYVDEDESGTWDETIDGPLDYLQTTLYRAKSGQTVRIIKSLTGEDKVHEVIIPEGITLDIQAFSLEAKYLVGLNGSYMRATTVKTSGVDGKLYIAQNNFELADDAFVETVGADKYDNVPIYDPVNKCFRFARFRVRTDDPTYHGLKFSTNEEGISNLYFGFVTDTTGYVNNNMVGDGIADNNLKIIVRIVWSNDNGVAYQDFEYKEEYVRTIFGGGHHFTLNINGYEALGITEDHVEVYGMIVSDSEAAAEGTHHNCICNN